MGGTSNQRVPEPFAPNISETVHFEDYSSKIIQVKKKIQVKKLLVASGTNQTRLRHAEDSEKPWNIGDSGVLDSKFRNFASDA